jgi:large subunit ribosomal protein L18
MTLATGYNRRTNRVRHNVVRQPNGRPRLSVFRSNKNIYAQIIDDQQNKTIASASTAEPDLKGKVKNGANKEAAELVGKLIAERALKAGAKEVVYDRGGRIYHGRLQALADGARAGGLSF